MATASAKAQLDVVVTGQQQLQTLNKSFGNLEASMMRLKTALAGVGFAAVTRSALQMAQTIQDLSDSTGIATNNILELQDALTRAGGQVDKMPDAIVRFMQSIDDAAKGSIDLQYAFGQVGVSLEDLRTLSEQDLLKAAIDGLARMGASAERTAIQTSLFGKSFRSVIPEELAKNMRNASGEFDTFAQSVSNAAKLGDRLENTANRLKIAWLEAFGPMINAAANFVEGLSKTEAGMQKLITLIKIIGDLAIVALSFTVVGKAVQIFGRLARGISGLLGLLGRNKKATEEVGEATAKWFSLQPNSRFMAALRGIGAAIAAAVGITWNHTAALEANGAAGEVAGQKEADAAKKAAEAQREVVDALIKRGQAMGEVFKNFMDQNSQLKESIDLEGIGANKSKEYNEILKMQVDMGIKAAEAIKRLKDQKAALTVQELKGGLGIAIDKTIEKIEQQARADSEAMERAIKYRNQLIQLENIRQFGLEQELNFQKELQAIADETAKLTLSDIEKKYYDIGTAARNAADAAIQAEAKRQGVDKLTLEQQKAYYEAAFKNVTKLKAAIDEHRAASRSWAVGWKQAFKEYMDAATNAAQNAKNIFGKAMQGMEDLIVNFAKTGKFEWKNFLAMMLEEMLRAQIRSTFASLFGGMQQDATSGSTSIFQTFVGMWKGLFNTTNSGSSGILSSFGGWLGDLGKTVFDGFGSILNGIGGFFGLGGGGIIGAMIDGVKSLGSSLFDVLGGIGGGVSNILGGIGSGISKIFSGSGGGGGGFWDTIKNVGSSILGGIGSLFGFANGGVIPHNGPVIVGERGPEIISGAAGRSVTPNHQLGGTNVTYNINAVDAASFKALVARDPQFIYAVTMQGAASLPSTRR